MLYICTHMRTVGVKGLMDNYRMQLSGCSDVSLRLVTSLSEDERGKCLLVIVVGGLVGRVCRPGNHTVFSSHLVLLADLINATGGRATVCRSTGRVDDGCSVADGPSVCHQQCLLDPTLQ